MKDASRSEDKALSASALDRLDQACDLFEQAWRAGQRPRLESYLIDAPASEAAALLRELLALELEYRRNQGESPCLQEYCQRFPGHLELVAQEFGQGAAYAELEPGEVHSARSSVQTERGPITTAGVEQPIRLGRYRITGTLGKGSFGVVYQGYDDELQRVVAIKVPHRQQFSETGAVEVYLREARMVASLDHPHIVPVHDFGHTDDGLCYVVSKFVEGSDLQKRLRETRLSITESAQLVATVAEALHHAHRRGLVHRDIKPSNILIDTAGEAHIVDFGLAMKEEDYGSGKPFAGTPAYMSPEQARGEGHRLDARSDIFSLGVVFYELLTGRHPFTSRARVQLLEQITAIEPLPPRQIDDTIPRELERICLKAVAKRASERYTTAQDMAQDLRHWQAEASRPVEVAGPRAPATPPGTPSSDASAIQIVPKGLRAFDASDADFFLELLPGPRSREGLPESVRFWKTKIEELDPDKTFTVGLLYGPSGCGKSSLMRAGLLPRLAGFIVAVYLEATPLDTESRLLKSLCKQCPELPLGLGLAETIAALRRGRGFPQGKKLLLVLDQFEQWLHANAVQDKTELIKALRQCDGERVQCIIMVRDDFGMAATRFMASMDVPILQGENFATLDLFETAHARRVLAAYGRAFGRLPDSSRGLLREQKAFLDQAIAGLAHEGKIITIQLALFAEMIKNKDWTGATLKAIGGMEGVGVTFLEETFASPHAPPQHRLHQKAARAVLKSLLPESGSDIKGQMQSQQKLLEVSGYADCPKDFETLLRILDAELRLITPTDPDERDAESQPSHAGAGERFYQLTHDYLIPSLREWLTRKQKETRRGRAQLRLAERAASWSEKAENRRLPSWWEWADIRLLTRKRDWTASQHKMMRKAGRFHGGRGLALVLFLAVLSWGGYQGFCWLQAEKLVKAIVSAETTEVSHLAEELNPYRPWADGRLRRYAQEAPANSRQHVHASLALVSGDSGPVEFLYHRLLSAGPTEFPVIRKALLPYKEGLIERLWKVVEHPEKGMEGQRLPAAGALAAYDPHSLRWDPVREAVAADLVGVPAVHLAAWKDSLRPVRDKLLPPLGTIFRDRQRRETERSLATEILVDYLAQEPNALTELLLDADDTQFFVLFPKLVEHVERAAIGLQTELNRECRPRWEESAFDPAWKEPDRALVQSIESAHGLWDQRFALCQTMPLKDFLLIAEGLRGSGYRPIRIRPYATETRVLVAAIWTRDGKEWKMGHDLSAQAAQKRNDENRAQSFHPVDVAGYHAGGKDRYVCLWVKDSSGNRVGKMQVPLDPHQVPAEDRRLQKEGYWRDTTTALATTDGRVHYAAIWSKRAGREPREEYMHMLNYVGENYLADLQVDVHIGKAPQSPSTDEQWPQLLAYAEKVLQANPANPDARFQRAMARIQLGEHEKANEDLTWIIEKSPKKSPLLYLLRSLSNARLGKAKESKDDVAKFEQLDRDFTQRAYLEAVVSAYLGEEAEGMKRLEAAIHSNPEQASLLYHAACAYSVVSGIFARKDAKKADHFADRAIDLLENCIASGYYPTIQEESDLDSVRHHARYLALLQAGKLERSYVAVWHPRGDQISTQVHGTDPIEHLGRCRKLVASGFRPVSISAAEIRAKQPLVTASVWHRPVVPDDDKEQLAKRQVNAAVALLKMGRPEKVWPMLRHSADPRVRSYLIHRFSPLAADPQAIVQRLYHEKEVSARRALLLCLGEFGEKELPPVERDALLPHVLDFYRDDQDPGIHGSARWLLQQWGQNRKLLQIDKELATGKVEGQRRWYVNSQGQTFAILGGGDFLMGSPRTELGREGGEEDRREPRHRTRIGRTFAIATHEVTVEQFLRFCPSHDYSRQYAPSPNCPVISVAWYEAASYCNLLSQREGLTKSEWCYEEFSEGLRPAPNYLKRKGYRLPTEAEWEYACRAGSSTSRYYGETDELLDKYAWCSRNSSNRSMPVGGLKPNDWGLFDMLGNGLEWTQDQLYNYYSVNLNREDKLSEDREHSEPRLDRILRGGSFGTAPSGVRCATRFNSLPMEKAHTTSFRLARTIH